jgi:hypothetical protein
MLYLRARKPFAVLCLDTGTRDACMLYLRAGKPFAVLCLNTGTRDACMLYLRAGNAVNQKLTDPFWQSGLITY